MNNSPSRLLICCSILKREIKRLIETGRLKADVNFLSSKLHYDYNLLEKALKRRIDKTLMTEQKNIVVIYGDVCLGFNNEMKKFTDAYGLLKVDAINCVDCLLGGKGQLLKTDPEHKFFFLTPEWITFWNKFEKSAQDLKDRYAMLEGIILLDSLGNLNDYKEEIKAISNATGLSVLDEKKVGLQGLQDVIEEAFNRLDKRK